MRVSSLPEVFIQRMNEHREKHAFISHINSTYRKSKLFNFRLVLCASLKIAFAWLRKWRNFVLHCRWNILVHADCGLLLFPVVMIRDEGKLI